MNIHNKITMHLHFPQRLFDDNQPQLYNTNYPLYPPRPCAPIKLVVYVHTKQDFFGKFSVNRSPCPGISRPQGIFILFPIDGARCGDILKHRRCGIA